MTSIGLVHLYLVFFRVDLWRHPPISENLLKITPVHRKIEAHSYIYSVWFQLMKENPESPNNWNDITVHVSLKPSQRLNAPEKNCSLEAAISFPFDLGCFNGLFPGEITANCWNFKGVVVQVISSIFGLLFFGVATSTSNRHFPSLQNPGGLNSKSPQPELSTKIRSLDYPEAWDRKSVRETERGRVFRGRWSKGDHEGSMFQYLFFEWWGILGMFLLGCVDLFLLLLREERKVFLAFQTGCFFLQEKLRSSSHSYLQTRKLKRLIIQRITYCTRKKLWKGDNQVKLCFKNCMSYS